MNWLEHPAVDQTREQRWWSIGAVTGGALLFLGVGAIYRNWLHTASFLPPALIGSGRVIDVLDVGRADQEASHHVEIAEALRVPRVYMDTFGYRIQDECGIVRKNGVMVYNLAPAPRGGKLVLRTDSFYKGDLLTTVNGRSMPAIHLEPRQTMFAYVEVPLPSDLGDGPLHVQQATSAADVGIFTIWLVEP